LLEYLEEDIRMMQRSLRKLTLRATLLIVIGLALQVVLVARPALAQDPPPRPTLPPTQTPTATALPTQTPVPKDKGPSPTSAPTGRIIGTVIDLSTNAPAPGIAVAVGDVTVTTDANGNYERAGLSAGSYQVALALTPAQGTPAQGPIAVELAAGATVVQHLAFRSPLVPTMTAVPTTPTIMPATPTAIPPTPTPSRPAMLPDTGDTPRLGLGMIGLVILLAGIVVWAITEWSRRNATKLPRF
jgi:hypothetical protein